MAEKRLPDKNGDKIRVVEYKGRYLPYVPNIAEKVDRLQNLEVRSDDVLICGYPRSGTNWVWEVVTMLLTGVAENSKQAKIDFMLEYRDLNHLSQLPSPRVLNSHLDLEQLPKDFVDKGCKMLYLSRNPKDVAVSMFHFVSSDLLSDYQGSWDGFQDLMLRGETFKRIFYANDVPQHYVMYGSWFENIKRWDKLIQGRNDLQIFHLRFEDLKIDFSHQVRRLAHFLGVNHQDEFYDEVERKCNFKNLKAAKDTCFDEEEKSYWRGGVPAYMRKGTIGDWKNTFTVQQNEEWDEKINSELRDVQMTFKYDFDS